MQKLSFLILQCLEEAFSKLQQIALVFSLVLFLLPEAVGIPKKQLYLVAAIIEFAFDIFCEELNQVWVPADALKILRGQIILPPGKHRGVLVRALALFPILIKGGETLLLPGLAGGKVGEERLILGGLRVPGVIRIRRGLLLPETFLFWRSLPPREILSLKLNVPMNKQDNM